MRYPTTASAWAMVASHCVHQAAADLQGFAKNDKLVQQAFDFDPMPSLVAPLVKVEREG